MEQGEKLGAIANQVNGLASTGELLWMALFALCTFLGVFWMVRGLLTLRRRHWEAVGFVLVAACLLWISGFSLAERLGESSAALLGKLVQIGMIVMFPLLLYHYWRQLYYKVVGVRQWVLMFTPTLVLIVLVLLGPVLPAPLAGFTIRSGWGLLLFCVHVLWMLGSCYQLYFNALYQTPSHMRRYTSYMLVALLLLTLGFVLEFLTRLLPGAPLLQLALAISMSLLSRAMLGVSSANVIATSRDFVFDSLSTKILVLSTKLRVLDWNQKNDDGPLPQPTYRETFNHYRTRIIRDCQGVVSPQADNILTLNTAGKETHYLLSSRPIENRQRRFGYLVEISEVTKIFDVMRVLEDVATVDQLTGLRNRNAYQNAVQQSVQDQVLPLVVVVGDVNNLKRLNDSLGHLVGDRLLTAVAEAIMVSMPDNTVAYRIGGDEFVLLMPHKAMEDAIAFIHEVDRRCAGIHDCDFGTPSISWGYALRESADQAYNDVFKRADAMMYAAKKQHHKFVSAGIVPAVAKPDAAEAAEEAEKPPQAEAEAAVETAAETEEQAPEADVPETG